MKNVLILGASRGIGLEFARQLCDQGVRVHASARKPADLEVLTKMGAHAMALDVSVPQEVERFLGQVQCLEFSHIVHVAGVFGPRTGALNAVGRSDFDQVMHTNVAPVLQMLPVLVNSLSPQEGQGSQGEHGSHATGVGVGRWISISSVMASISLTQDSSGWLYKISKAALNMSIHAASKQYKNKILVAMSPGWVKTDMVTSAAPLTPEVSVSNMLKTIEALTLKDSGRFINHDGSPLTW